MVQVAVETGRLLVVVVVVIVALGSCACELPVCQVAQLLMG